MLDWDDLRFFLAVARLGSLSAAAKELHVAQSTVGRRLASLEAGLGVRLLNRTPDGYVVTLAGLEVREKAERLEKEAHSLERDVGGRDTRLTGLVRVTCAESVASHILAPCFAALHRQHPEIMIELIPDPRQLSLSMREAEISVRLSRPDQHDLTIRRLGSLAFGLYASRSYLGQHGELDFEGGLPRSSSYHAVGRHPGFNADRLAGRSGPPGAHSFADEQSRSVRFRGSARRRPGVLGPLSRRS